MQDERELFFHGYFRGRQNLAPSTHLEGLYKFCEWCFVGIDGWYLDELIHEKVSFDSFVRKCVEEAKIRNTEIDEPIPFPENEEDVRHCRNFILTAVYTFNSFRAEVVRSFLLENKL